LSPECFGRARISGNIRHSEPSLISDANAIPGVADGALAGPEVFITTGHIFKVDRAE
jgi:hypothetical protein